MIVRHGTAADVEAFFGKLPYRTLQQVRVALLDGKVVSVAGLARSGGCLTLFWSIAEGCEDAMRGMTVLRAIKAVMRDVAAQRLPVVAVGDNPALLERLGFVCIGGNDYQWPTYSATPARSPPPTSENGPECAAPSGSA